jgi:tetratricopeptide (TPR) repeat protein
VRADQNEVFSEVSSKLLSVKKVLSLAKEALVCNQKLFQTEGQEEENYRYKLKMDKIESQLDSRFKKTTRFIKNFGIDKFILSAQTDSSQEWSNDKLEETGRLYYQAYIDSCEALIGHLTNTYNRVLNRQQEHKAKPEFSSLFEQWQKDKNVGRAKVWQRSYLHKDIEIPAQYINQFKQFEQEFSEIIANENTAHLTRTIKEASLNGVRRKIITLFQQGNIDALKVLSQSLALHKKSSDEAKPLHNLSLAYLYSAIEDYNSSLTYFESLPSNAIFEDELQQIMTIAFKLTDYPLASACLEKLSNITDIYMSKHAKLLKLLGETDKAIILYTKYLASFNEDTQAWLELGELYFDIKAYDAALVAFEVVLSQDTTNLRALDLIEEITQIQQG